MRTVALSTRATTAALPQSARALSPQCWSCSWFNAQSRCGPEWGAAPPSLVVGSSGSERGAASSLGLRSRLCSSRSKSAIRWGIVLGTSDRAASSRATAAWISLIIRCLRAEPRVSPVPYLRAMWHLGARRMSRHNAGGGIVVPSRRRATNGSPEHDYLAIAGIYLPRTNQITRATAMMARIVATSPRALHAGPRPPPE
jgi:hypothetical protein